MSFGVPVSVPGGSEDSKSLEIRTLGQVEKLLEISVMFCLKIYRDLSAGLFHGLLCTVLIKLGVC